MVGHHVPVKRSTILVMELVGMQVSTGFAAGLRGRAAALIRDGGFLDAVKKLLATAPVVHADETFARAAGKTTYVHVACTEHLALMHTGDRSAATIDAGGVLPDLGPGQVLVRDGYAGYTHLTNVLHAWCGAHLLRDLRGIHEADPTGQLWAKAMADTLLEAHRIATAARCDGRDTLSENELRTIDRLYTGALARARIDNPASDRSVLAGHARTLAARFETHRTVILRFTTDLAVGFTNNAAERQVRPVKVTATILRRLLANTARTGRLRRRPVLPVHRRPLGHHPIPSPPPPLQRRRALDPHRPRPVSGRRLNTKINKFDVGSLGGDDQHMPSGAQQSWALNQQPRQFRCRRRAGRRGPDRPGHEDQMGSGLGTTDGCQFRPVERVVVASSGTGGPLDGSVGGDVNNDVA